MASDDDGKAACPANLGGKNQKTQPDGEMGHDQRGQQNGLYRALEGERIAIERKGESCSHQQGDGGGPAGDDEAIAKARTEVLIGEGLGKPTPRPSLGGKRENCLVVEGSQSDDSRRENDEAKNGQHGEGTGNPQHALESGPCHINADRISRGAELRPARG